jgi:hypothetical protein
MVLSSLLCNRLVVQMKNDNHILIQYPDEDLFEDGELSDNKHDILHRISEVEYKILQMWRNDKIVIARWEKLNGR